MKSSLCLILLLTLSISAAQAGATGYMYRGKTVYLYKDGVKVQGENEDISTSRGLAKSTNDPVLYFSEDELARCYFRSASYSSKSKRNIHCIKKSEIK